MGIAKIDTTKRIAKDSARQVTFSKRRSGLFKKAFELSVLCELEMAIIVFSQKNKVFTFAHPDIDYVIAKYRDPDNVERYDEEKLKQIHAGKDELIPRYEHAILQTKIGKDRNQQLKQMKRKIEQKGWESLDVDNMSLKELQEQSDELQGFLDLCEEHQKNNDRQKQQGVESSQPVIHQPQSQLPHLLSGPASEEPMMFRNPAAASQPWQSSGPVVGDGVYFAAMPRPGVPGSMTSTHWQQPSSNSLRDPNLPLSANMRHVLCPQNCMCPGAQPMASFPTVICGQNFRPQGLGRGGDGGIQHNMPAAGPCHPPGPVQQQRQQQQQDQQQLRRGSGGPTTPTFFSAPHMHPYHVNQQIRHMETMQGGRPFINYALQFQAPPMGPPMGQNCPGTHEMLLHYQGNRHSCAWESQNFGESGFHEGNQFSGGVSMLHFDIPYDNTGHGIGLPNVSTTNRNHSLSGCRTNQIGQGTPAESGCGNDMAPNNGMQHMAPDNGMQLRVNEDCRYSFDNNLAFQGVENNTEQQYESYAVQESGDMDKSEGHGQVT